MKSQFEIISPWIEFVLKAIAKEIKTEHLPASKAFARAHFGNRPLNRLSSEEIFSAYAKDLLAGNADLAEWVVNRWVFKHGDIYSHFAERLQCISKDYASIQSLNEEQSEEILRGAADKFGSLPVYLFSVLNAVVFPDVVFSRLRVDAEREEGKQKAEAQRINEQQNFEQTLKRYQSDMVRMQAKYEDKISGVMKKYATDVAALKKQIRALQHRLNSHHE